MTISIFTLKGELYGKILLVCFFFCRVYQNQMSRNKRKPTMWILTRSDTNQAVQPLEMARGLKFCI